MEDIQLIVSRADLEKQYKFLKRFSVNNRLKRHRPFFFILVVLFLVDVWLFSFTGASAFITAKGFLYFISLITLALTGVYGIIIASENARSNQAIAEEMEGFVANKWNVVIRFDNDKVVYTTQE